MDWSGIRPLAGSYVLCFTCSPVPWTDVDALGEDRPSLRKIAVVATQQATPDQILQAPWPELNETLRLVPCFERLVIQFSFSVPNEAALQLQDGIRMQMASLRDRIVVRRADGAEQTDVFALRPWTSELEGLFARTFPVPGNAGVLL